MLSTQELPKSIVMDKDTIEDLHNLLYQLNWLNDVMQTDRCNSIVNALLMSIDDENKDQITEAVQALSRINLSDRLIKKSISILQTEGGAQ